MVEPVKAAEFIAALESGPYAWPGGYPLYFIMADGEALSFGAAKAEQKRIVEEMLLDNAGVGFLDRQWIPVACEINWEDTALYCADTNERIPSAYGDDPPGDDPVKPDTPETDHVR